MPSRRAAALVVAIEVLLAAAACTPIPAPDEDRNRASDWGAARVDRPLPDFDLADAAGKPLRPADLLGSIVVMTFASLQPGPSHDRSTLLIERLADVRRRFPAEKRLRLLVILLDDPPARDIAALTAAGLEALTGPPLALEELASAFGIGVFRDPDGIVHASETVIIDATGVVRAIWPGVDSWSQADVLEMVSEQLVR